MNRAASVQQTERGSKEQSEGLPQAGRGEGVTSSTLVRLAVAKSPSLRGRVAGVCPADHLPSADRVIPHGLVQESTPERLKL